MNYIVRPDYLNKLKDYTNTDFIKVLSGIRRCGKSTILQMYADMLASEYGSDSVLLINFDSPDYLDVTNAKELAALLKEKLSDMTKYVLLDEIQLIEGWERVISAYYSAKRYELVLTGSNAQMLSSELATHLTGRYVEIAVYPLSYREFLTFRQQDSSNVMFEEYLQYGSMPAVVNSDSREKKFNILQSILDSILFNDVLRRSPSVKADVLIRVVKVLNDNVGYPVSLNKIAHSLKSAGYKAYYESVSSLVDTLISSMLYLQAEFMLLKGRERFGSQLKLYCADHGIMNLTRSHKTENYSSLLENIVFVELKRRGYKISIGREGAYEVDFIAERGKTIEYYQVTESLLNQDTREREFRSLEAIRDNYPKYILSMDSHDFSRNGIICRNLVDFLSGAE